MTTRSPLSSRLALIAGGALLAILAAGLGLVYLLLPDHVSVDVHATKFLRPDDGYTWISPADSFDWSVQWTPGLPSPVFPNVMASLEPDKWRPAPGYGWANAEASNREVVWVSGRREPDFPHAAAGTQPGTWFLDPGYAFAAASVPWPRGSV
ncbi:MAG: hypothetical protein ACJ759_19225 [Thermoanaerobaculia bacterium]